MKKIKDFLIQTWDGGYLLGVIVGWISMFIFLKILL